MINTGATDGEKLCALIRRKFVSRAQWPTLASEIRFTAVETDWSLCFQQMIAVNVTGRIVAGGQSFAEEFGFSDPQFELSLRQFIRDTLLIPRENLDELLRFAIRATRAARQHLSPGQANELSEWAAKHHAHCYICGQILKFERASPAYNDYTADHIWPRNYGGNSEPENILPACSHCNHSKKQGFATWAMTSFQSVNLGLNPSDNAFTCGVAGEHRFALHYKAAQRVAEENRWSLKQAFRAIGPWTNLRLIDAHDVGHFFNLRIHNEV